MLLALVAAWTMIAAATISPEQDSVIDHSSAGAAPVPSSGSSVRAESGKALRREASPAGPSAISASTASGTAVAKGASDMTKTKRQRDEEKELAQEEKQGRDEDENEARSKERSDGDAPEPRTRSSVRTIGEEIRRVRREVDPFSLEEKTSSAAADLAEHPWKDVALSMREQLRQEEAGRKSSEAVGARSHSRQTQAPCDEELTGPLDAGYRGCQSQTRSGKTCQKWSVQSPQTHTRTDANYPDAGVGDHNYCRNPDGEPSIWCYTTDVASRWELCDPVADKSDSVNLEKKLEDRMRRLEERVEKDYERRTEEEEYDESPAAGITGNRHGHKSIRARRQQTNQAALLDRDSSTQTQEWATEQMRAEEMHQKIQKEKRDRDEQLAFENKLKGEELQKKKEDLSCAYGKDGQLYAPFEPGTLKCLKNGLAIYNYHLAWPGGRRPSLLQTVEDVITWVLILPTPAGSSSATPAVDLATPTPPPTPMITIDSTASLPIDIAAICDALDRSSAPYCAFHGDIAGEPFIIMKATETQLSDLNLASFKAEADHIIFNHTDDDSWQGKAANHGIEKAVECPAESYWTCSVESVAQKISQTNLPFSWGLDRIDALKDDDMGLDCRSRDKDTGTGGADVDIWILDTGLRASHEDFGGRAQAVFDVTKDTGAVECSKSTDPECGRDVNGHGTHCAGSAAGTKYGVAPKANILGGKILGDNKDGKLSWATEGIDYVIRDYLKRGKKPTVVSMSLGGKGNSPILKAAADKMTEVGIVVTVAAGNQGDDACNYNPAFVRGAITVGATDVNDKMPAFSNYGKCVDILAPGSAINSAGTSSDTAEVILSGTSMACPHVAGAAALLLAGDSTLHTRDEWTAAKVFAKLLVDATTDKVTVKPGTPNKLLNIRELAGVQDTSAKLLIAASIMVVIFILVVVAVVYVLLCSKPPPKEAPEPAQPLARWAPPAPPPAPPPASQPVAALTPAAPAAPPAPQPVAAPAPTPEEQPAAQPPVAAADAPPAPAPA